MGPWTLRGSHAGRLLVALSLMCPAACVGVGFWRQDALLVACLVVVYVGVAAMIVRNHRAEWAAWCIEISPDHIATSGASLPTRFERHEVTRIVRHDGGLVVYAGQAWLRVPARVEGFAAIEAQLSEWLPIA